MFVLPLDLLQQKFFLEKKAHVCVTVSMVLHV